MTEIILAVDKTDAEGQGWYITKNTLVVTLRNYLTAVRGLTASSIVATKAIKAHPKYPELLGHVWPSSCITSTPEVLEQFRRM